MADEYEKVRQEVRDALAFSPGDRVRVHRRTPRLRDGVGTVVGIRFLVELDTRAGMPTLARVDPADLELIEGEG